MADRVLVGRAQPPVLGVHRTRIQRSTSSVRRAASCAADPWSDPRDESGYSASDLITLGFINSPDHMKLVQETRALADVSVDDYVAVFMVGGQAPMYTFYQDERVHDLAVSFYEAGKVTAVVCHATSMLLKARLPDGDLLVKGKTWTGFANSEEDYADEYVGQRIQPFRIEDQARAIAESNFIVHGRFRPHAVPGRSADYRAAAVLRSRCRTAGHQGPGPMSRSAPQSTRSMTGERRSHAREVPDRRDAHSH